MENDSLKMNYQMLIYYKERKMVMVKRYTSPTQRMYLRIESDRNVVKKNDLDIALAKFGYKFDIHEIPQESGFKYLYDIYTTPFHFKGIIETTAASVIKGVDRDRSLTIWEVW
jgi:hypothetical protein